MALITFKTTIGAVRQHYFKNTIIGVVQSQVIRHLTGSLL